VVAAPSPLAERLAEVLDEFAECNDVTYDDVRLSNTPAPAWSARLIQHQPGSHPQIRPQAPDFAGWAAQSFRIFGDQLGQGAH
jgi:hypothetical protein